MPFRTFFEGKKVRFEAAHGAKGNFVLFWDLKKYDLGSRLYVIDFQKHVDEKVDDFDLISSTFSSTDEHFCILLNIY